MHKDTHFTLPQDQIFIWTHLVYVLSSMLYPKIQFLSFLGVGQILHHENTPI